jgi:hypothetical protein
MGIFITDMVWFMLLSCCSAHVSASQPSLLITRFMFNLRQLNPNRSQLGSSAEQHRSLPTLRFSAHSDFLGNIGEPLDHDQSEHAVADADHVDLDPGPLNEDGLIGRFGQHLEHALSNQASAFHAD